MTYETWKKVVKSGTYFIVVCFSLSLFFGVMAQAYTSSSQISVSNNIDSGNFVIGFGDKATSNSIMPYSTSDTVEISAKVYVRSYHRKDGTYVRSHYRRDPR